MGLLAQVRSKKLSKKVGLFRPGNWYSVNNTYLGTSKLTTGVHTRSAIRVCALAAVLLSAAALRSGRLPRIERVRPSRQALIHLGKRANDLYLQDRRGQPQQLDEQGYRQTGAARDLECAARFANNLGSLDDLGNAVAAAELHGDDRVRFECWSLYAHELFLSGDLARAERAALNAWRLGQLSAVGELRSAYLELGRIYRAQGNFALAGALFERGLAMPVRNSDRQLWTMYFLYERGLLRKAQHRPLLAAADLRAALADAQRWRESSAPSDSLSSGTGSWLKDLYDAYVEAALDNNLSSEAFLASEQQSAANLLQTLVSPAGAPWYETDLKDLARPGAVEVGRPANPAAYDPDRGARTRQSFSGQEARAGARFTSVSDQSWRPDSRNSENFLSPNTLRDIQDRVRPEEALISFHLGDTASYVWALTRGGLEMQRLGPRGKLTSIAARFREAVEQAAPERNQLGAELYADLFGRLSKSVRDKRAWSLTSDNDMFDVPFAALVVARRSNGDAVFLIEKHELQTVSSAFLIGCGRARSGSGPFLGVGDGVYNSADERWYGRSRHSRRFRIFPFFGANHGEAAMELPRLASSASEIRACSASWESQRRPVLLTGFDASPAKLSAALEKAPAVIHIAAHVVYPAGNPSDALIHLGLAPDGSQQVLTARDVTNLRAAGALVVLSGCSSAAGASVRGPAIRGLTRAWLLAGACAVVGSRWPVPDDTGELFHSFYAHMAVRSDGRQELASALRQAQLQMLRSKTFRSDPKYWGAFYLVARD